MAVIVCGIDPSTSTGIYAKCAYDSSGYTCTKRIEYEGKSGMERLKLISQAVRSAMEEIQPDVVFIEGYNYRNKFTFRCMVEVGTVIRQVLFDMGIPYTEIAPTQLKLWTAASGNANKAAMAVAVKEKWGFTHKSDDVVDAYALAQLGCAVIRQEFDPSAKAPRKKKPRKPRCPKPSPPQTLPQS